jgi:hypothetical protein
MRKSKNLVKALSLLKMCLTVIKRLPNQRVGGNNDYRDTNELINEMDNFIKRMEE